jgi:hypothetical protein
MLSQVGNFLNYVISKRYELADLETKDAFLAKTILDIHRKRTHSDFVIVQLFSLTQVHAIDHENAIKATQDRVNVLQENKIFLLGKKTLTRDVLSEVLPSISAIKVVRQSDNNYIAFEGNGRIAALQEVFSPSDCLTVEVEKYHFKNPDKILRRMDRVRRLNNLQD